MPVSLISLVFGPPLQEPHARRFSDVGLENRIDQPRHDSILQTREASSECGRVWSCVIKGGFSEYGVIFGAGQVGIPETFAKT